MAIAVPNLNFGGHDMPPCPIGMNIIRKSIKSKHIGYTYKTYVFINFISVVKIFGRCAQGEAVKDSSNGSLLNMSLPVAGYVGRCSCLTVNAICRVLAAIKNS